MAPVRCDLRDLRLLPYAEAVPLAREALAETPDGQELGLFLWDDRSPLGVTVAATDLAEDLAEERYADAYDRLLPLVDEPTCFPNLVEAAVRSGHADVAAPYVADLEARATANGSAWCAGVAARSRALIEPDEKAERHYRSAIELLAGTNARVDLARAHLLYGEWLRQVDRGPEAERQLATAGDLLEVTGAMIFGRRAGRSRADHELTPDELSIMRLVGDGHTNAEIAELLLLSPNTVDHHLRNIIQKLGVSSRRQLEDRAAA